MLLRILLEFTTLWLLLQLLLFLFFNSIPFGKGHTIHSLAVSQEEISALGFHRFELPCLHTSIVYIGHHHILY